VEELQVPYVWPQENGGRTDAAWVALRTPAGAGLAFLCTANSAPAPPPRVPGGPPALQLFTASRHSWQELEAAHHQHELPARGAERALHVHLDAAHMGLGGDDSWSPCVHDEYLLAPGVYEFGVAVLPCGGGAA